MTLSFFIGELLTGARLQPIAALSGEWSEVLNDAGSLSCDAPLNDPVVKALGLRESAIPGKSFLAAIDGDTVLQAGPIWAHHYNRDTKTVTLNAAGMLSYFDHRVLLPYPTADPSLAAADTRYTDVVSDPDDPGYPWAVDTRKSLQGIARAIVSQAMDWPNGDVPVILPTEVPGVSERWYKGVDLAFVGERLRQLTQVDGGPDIMFTPRLTSTKDGVEWVMRIGTTTEPLLYSAQEQSFFLSVSSSSVSDVSVDVDGASIGGQSFATGGRNDDKVVITVSSTTALSSAGYPLLELVDSSHTTVSDIATLQTYSDELVARSLRPIQTIEFDHDATQHPYVESFNVGDFAKIRTLGDYYLPDGERRMRLISRAGSMEAKKRIKLTFQPEAI